MRYNMSLQLKKVLEQHKLSILALSRMTGITQANLSNIANGKASPKVEILERIAKALNVPITELFDAGASDELTALIQYKGDFYKATTIAELEEVVSRIKASRHDDK